MDDKQMQELNALEQAAFNDPVNFLNQEHNPRKWTLSSEDIARSYSITPAQLLHTEDELNPRKWNVAETLAREFGTGAINMFESAAEGIANSKLQKVIYRSNNMSKEDADRLVEDVLRSQVISRNRQNLEHARRVHDVWSAGIANGIGSVASMALVGAATKSPIAVGALTGIGEAYNVRNEMIDRYVEEKGTTEGVAGKLPEYNALSAAYGVVAGAIEGSIGVERLAAGSLNRYGKLAAMERLARQQGKYGKALAYKTGREFVATGAEEAGEEFLQSISEDVAIALVQDMWEDPDLKKALTQGMFGAIVGAPAGAIFYNGSRKRIIDYINKWNNDKKAGLTESQVVQMTDEILGNGAHTMVDDITTRVEIKEHFGKAYDLVKQRLTEQIDATGTTPWTDQNKSKEEYIQTLADSITIPAINVANILHIPLSDFLEIADINTATIAGNIAWLRPITSIADIDTIIANQDAIIKEQTEAKKLGVGNEDILQRARQRKAIAQRVRKDLAIENGIRTQRSNRKKENADYITAKDLQPEQVQTLENATQAQPGQEYVLFAGKRIPVEYQVVELATIQPSHIDGMPNPAYTNTELQNRASRGTTQDVADLREKATNITPERLMRASTSAEGAPVVNAQGQVIAGNGRTEIVRYAYQNPESAEKYKQELVKQGFNIDGMQQPILVRRNTTMTDQEQVAAADISNISEISAFDEASQARRDTQYLKDSPTPTDFAAKLPMSERRGLMQNNGRWNKRKVQQRYESALLAWLCGNDTQLFENLVLDRVLTQKVIDVLTANGSLVYETATKYPELQIREDIYHALIKMQRATRDNFLEITQQLELDGRDVMPENILVWNWLFADPTTNRQYLSNYATILANNHENANAGQDMFGQQVAPLSKKDAVMQALKKTDEAKAELSASRGREYQPLFDENGMATDPNLVAAIASYQNQFAPQAQLENQILNKQYFDLADENARLDDIYPEYTGDKIEVDGKERTVYNSNGDRIAKSKEALTNFWRWFGDSKVVDEQGRPLVVYHGARTETRFDTFRQGVAFFTSNRDVAQVFSDEYAYNLVVDGKKIPLDYDTAQHLSQWLSGYDYGIDDVIEWNNFADLIQERGQESYEDARDSGEFQSGNLDMVDLFNANNVHFEIGSQPMAMYLKIETPKIVDAKGQEWLAGKFDDSDLIDLSGGYDGSIVKNIKEGGPTATMRDSSDVPVADDYIVYSNTQIKSVDNRGTYSSDTGNIYYQETEPVRPEPEQELTEEQLAAIPDDLEFQDLADENARLDDIYPEYTGDTIEVDGKERTVYNSNGDRIAKSKEALTNFWKWFGDSKVVDEQGRPLVVYHGSDVSGIEVFDNQANQTKQRQIGAEKGFFFTDSKKVAERFRTTEQRKAESKYYAENTIREPVTEEKYDAQGRYLGSVHYAKITLPESKNFGLYSVYLKAESVNEYSGEDIGVGEERAAALESAKQSGKDGVVIYKADTGAGIANEYIAFEPTQIKSVDNRGTYSSDTGNIYFQSAYAGSRVDYDKPSLEAIGSGEGAAAHGWGLYYALDKKIAERYRYAFTQSESNKYKEEELNDLYTSLIDKQEYGKATIIESLLIRHTDEDIDDMLAEGTITQKDVDWFRSIEDKYLDKTKKEGQVHEVDIPEMNYLLDEQKGFSEQPEFVQEKVKETLNDLGIKKIRNIDIDSKSNFIASVKQKLGQEAADIMSDIYDLEIKYKDSSDNTEELDAAWNRWNEFEKNHDTKGFDPNIVYSFQHITGEAIYDALVEKLGTAKEASQILEKHGIKGITYEGGMDGRCFVIFNPADVKVLRKKFDELGNVLFQKRGVIRGQYDPELPAILLTKYWNETTLVHEYHHRFLEKLFNYFKQAQTGERAVPDAFMTDMQQLFNILDIDPTQDQLTVVQQEKFATMVEAYLTGLGVDHPENLAFQSFLHWIPEQYQSILNLGYLDEQGNIVNPVLDEQTIAWFNKWFANPFMPSLATAPEIQHLTNPTDANGEIIPSSQKVMNNREKDWGQDSEEQNKADAQLWRAINENTPNDMRAALDGEKEVMKEEAKNLPDDTKLPEEHKPTMREKWFKTYQPSARERAAQMAREYLTKNPEHARELAFADPETSTEFDAPVDRAMLIRAVMETVPHGSDEWYILNDNLATVKSMSGSTLSLAGDESHRAYLDAKREVEDARELKAAVNYAGTRRGALEKWNSDIKAFIAKRTAQIVATEPNSIERKTAIKAFLEEAKTKFSANTTNAVLNQMDLTGMQTKNSQVFIKWAEKQIKQAAHAKIDTAEQKELMKASIAAQLALKEIDSTAQTDGKFTRAIQSAKDIRHWQFVKDKIKKAYIGRWGKWGIFTENLFGGYVPSAMLMSVNTLFFANVPSTAINTGTIRLAAKAIGNNNVDKKTQKDEIERIRQVFNASGVNLAQMDKPTSPSTLHGEKYMNTEQKHWYNFTFEILGRTDNLFRIPTFVDALARIATKNADGDKAKATALFKAYAQLNNKDESAKTARKQALAVANMAVFTQDGTLSTALNHIRSILNTLSRAPLGLDPNGFGLGNVLAPFLKTGANITEMGLSATLALPRTAIMGLKKLQGKQIPDLDKIAIRADWMNLAWTAVMVALLCALSGDDDDWYTEPYQSGRKYDPNKPYDSIRFGNTWVKLDVFGPVAIPLRTAAMTIKDWEKRKLASIGDGMFEALSDTPLVQQFTDSSLDYMNRQPGAYWSGFAYNQANKFVPAQAKTLAKAISRKTGYKLDTTGAGKTIDRKFHRNYGFDGAELTTNDLINVLTNRLKYNPQ